MTEVRPGPGDIVRMRASALGELFDDSLRWAAKILDHRYGPTYGRSHLGTSVHFGTADFDRQTTLPDGKPDVEVAVAKFLEIFNDDEKVSWTDLPKAKAEGIGLNLVIDYCNEISPQFNWVAVEALCEPLLITMPNGIIFEITGTVDRVYEKDDKHGIADLKTGYAIITPNAEVDVAKHGPQLATYDLLEMMAESATGFDIKLPAIVIGLSTSGNGTMMWEEVQNPRTLLFGDGINMGYLLAASEIIASQLYIGNPRSMLCTEKYCPIYNECFYRLGDQR